MSGRMTLLDFAKSKDPDGQQAQVIELLEQYNPILKDAPAYPSNAPLGNRVTYRRSLPSVGSAKINKGVTRSKSATDQRVDPIGIFSGRSEVDRRIIDIEGMAAFTQKRKMETAAFTEAFAQLLAYNVAYGDTKTDEAAFDGLAPRTASLNPNTSRTTSQVHSMGTVTGSDGCSVFIVDWGEYACKAIFPLNTTAGLRIDDIGETDGLDEDSASLRVYAMLYDWYLGISVPDPRHIARIPNIDLSDSLLASPTQGSLIDKIRMVMDLMPVPGPSQRVLYCPMQLKTAIRQQAEAKGTVVMTVKEYLNEQVDHIDGFPIRSVEQFSTAEATVS